MKMNNMERQGADNAGLTSFILTFHIWLCWWGLLSAFSLLILYFILGSPIFEAAASLHEKNKWASLRSVTISTAFIGLSLMSVINFATAEIGALLIVPICLMARPLKLDIQARSWSTLLRASCNIALGFIVFPPVAFVLLKGAFEDFYGMNFGDYWNWVESLWVWNSATYLYVGVIHLPCWALCIHILFHPCWHVLLLHPDKQFINLMFMFSSEMNNWTSFFSASNFL